MTVRNRNLSLLLPVLLCAAAPAAASSQAECLAGKLDPSLGIVGQLRDAHLDLSQARSVSHLFVGPTAKLKLLKATLTRLGFQAAQIQGSKRLLVITSATVDEPWVRSTLLKMCAAAEQAQVEYDGWDVDVEADKITSQPAR